ncbi:NUDIX domain-containing protein [Lacticaseibacillus absianus]|uniref:NUDIX domain-containing protein n=1 Tax=Lacticaseibacillus absianus TaxID=2729623 RepID=UPI0015C7D917|nr:NUDIX hydrolase [Lacticaseibacillus absianus]
MERIVTTETLYRGRILTLTRATVALPDGRTQVREIVRTHGAAGVLAIRGARALFVRQWRTPLRQETLELPAGRIEPGESPLQCAQRELNEEAQLAATTWQALGAFYQSAGFSDAQTHLFMATGLHHPAHQRPLDDGEQLAGEWLTLDQAQAAQAEGTLCDAKTLIGLNAWRAMRQEEDHG